MVKRYTPDRCSPQLSLTNNRPVVLSMAISILAIANPAWSQLSVTDAVTDFNPISHQSLAQTLAIDGEVRDFEIPPEVLEGSPVLQNWLEEIPDVLEEIGNDPSFRTRVRFGYFQIPSTDDRDGFYIAVEDIFLGKTRLTVSGEYQQTFDGEHRRWGTDVGYNLLPMGGYFNITPIVGYRNLETEGDVTDGINVGVRLLLVLSRGGAADISLTQSFVSPGGSDEVGITTLSFGYAVTSQWRLSTLIQQQNTRVDRDRQVGVALEWMP